MNAPELRIGTRIDILFENEINKGNAHYMKGLVYDYEGKDVTISQTTPKLGSQYLNRRILVTYLARNEKKVLRYGFSSRLVNLRSNYQISSDNEVEALVLQQLETPAQVDFRTHYRVKPQPQNDVHIFFAGGKVNLIDISLIGAKFSYPKSHLFDYGEIVQLKLTIEGKAFEFEARVCHLSLPHGFADNKDLQYVGVKFEHVNKQLDSALSRLIIGIERQLLSQGKSS